MNDIKNFIEVPIALIVAICGIAYPIILQIIGQIDTKYGSTRLINRIKRSWQYNLFITSLWIAVISILYYPFAPIRTCDLGMLNTFLDEHSLKVVIYLPTVILLFSLVKFSKLTLKFYSHIKLLNSIVDDMSKKKDVKQESENHSIKDYNRKETPAEAAFKDWTDLAVHCLQSSNDDTISDIYSSIYGYAIRYNKSYTKKIVEYPHYFYRGLQVINKVACKLEPELSSHHNLNLWLQF